MLIKNMYLMGYQDVLQESHHDHISGTIAFHQHKFKALFEKILFSKLIRD